MTWTMCPMMSIKGNCRTEKIALKHSKLKFSVEYLLLSVLKYN